MERCVCQICLCGGHKCRNRQLKDVLGQEAGNPALPVTETTEAYPWYRRLPPVTLTKPLAADWYYKVGQPTFIRKKKLQFIELPTEKDIKIEKPTSNTYDLEPLQDYRAVEAGMREVVPTEPTRFEYFRAKPEQKEKLTLPPIMSRTTHLVSYQPLPCVSQMPNCRKRESYRPPEIPMRDKTTHQCHYQPWDVTSELRAPDPKTGALKMGPPTNNLKPYDVPMNYLTTFRDAYCMPPLRADDLFIQQTGPHMVDVCEEEFQCRHHSEPKERFFNQAIFRSTYKRDYGPPCMNRNGICLHVIKGDCVTNKNCPAACLVHGYAPDNYEYVRSLCGHDMFKEQKLLPAC